jgi:hypothetical protein
LGEFVSAIADLCTDFTGVEKRFKITRGLFPQPILPTLLRFQSPDRRVRDTEGIHEIIFRLEKILSPSELGKIMPKVLQIQLVRLREVVLI